jgi:hypothetical protein
MGTLFDLLDRRATEGRGYSAKKSLPLNNSDRLLWVGLSGIIGGPRET